MDQLVSNQRINAVRPVATGTQAERIYAKFGGVPAVFRALRAIDKPRAMSVIYRWNYPKKHGGSDGLVPTSALADVMAAARFEGLILTAEDLYPPRI